MRVATRIASCTLAIFLLVGIAPEAVAETLVESMPGVWVPATALSLTLVTAVMKSQK